MAEAETKQSNWEGALNPFTNTFDSISSEINAIIAQRRELVEVYPDQRVVIKKMADDQIDLVLADAGVSKESYREALQTAKQYALPFDKSPHTYVKGIARALGQGLFLGFELADKDKKPLPKKAKTMAIGISSIIDLS